MSQKKSACCFQAEVKINNPNQEECLFFNSSRISISRTSVEEGGAGAAASSGAVRVSLLAPFISQNNTIAIHRNEIVADRKLPYFTPFQLRSAILSAFTALKAGFRRRGVITSSTSEVTICPKAAPIITPTARSITLPLKANCLNS